MNAEEFQKILPYLRLYKDCCRDKESIDAWYYSLRAYDFKTIDQALTDYMAKYTYTPVPAHIIGMIPKALPEKEYKPRYETINGITKRVIQCRRCNDTGLKEWTDEDGYVYGKPCDCPAGHDRYKWGWLTQEEQEEYIRKNGNHGETVGEDWTEFDDI